MSLIFATQLTAVATVALAVLALAAAIVAGIALYKQSRALAILAEQNNRDIVERHQAQAARVFTVVEDRSPGYAHPYARNGSDFPVYDAQLWQAGPNGLADADDALMIPPGGRIMCVRDIRYPDALANTVLTFRDAAGARWIRMPDGTLKEQERDTARDSVLAVIGQSPPGTRAPELPKAPKAPKASRDPAAPAP
jgi:hypothetical protein